MRVLAGLLSLSKRVSSCSLVMPPKYLSASEAQRLDEELFTSYNFSVDQLMELAGLACAHAIVNEYKHVRDEQTGRVLVCCGPGNNGGDGLVCARHLKLHAFTPIIYYPKRPSRPLFNQLVEQCSKSDISFIETMPTSEMIEKDFKLVVDAIFGFSFVPPIRAPFDTLIKNIVDSSVEVVSIDVPSGCNVDSVENVDDVNGLQLSPQTLISLTAPKKCAMKFNGKSHYLGGRFIPQDMSDKYQLNLPPYEDLSTIVKLK